MSWKQKLHEFDLQTPKNIDDIADESTAAKTNDVGFVNPNSGAGVLGRENGDLEGFADYGLGFRFNREKQSLSIFAPTINLFSTNINKQDTLDKKAYFVDELKDVEAILNGINK